MKTVILATLLSLAACATPSGPRSSGPHRINVHAVKVEIQRTIGDGRTITSMGKVTEDSATVYTRTSAGRREETWSKGPTGWSLHESHEVAAAR